MIFLSHNHKDKILVEQIAVRLERIYGSENIFYDSWSIQPGDGIIDKINTGLEGTKYFFFFSSKNSLNSEVVKLEWENALMKSIKGGLKIIPVRLDLEPLPSILLQKLYLDLYTNGIEVTLSQMISVINNESTFKPKDRNFSNLVAYIYNDSKDIIIDIYAEYFMEPISSFCVLSNSQKDDIVVSSLSDMMVFNNYSDDLILSNGIKGNAWFIGVSRATTPGFPFRIKVSSKINIKPQVLTVMHEISSGNFQTIPIVLNKKMNQ